MKQLNISKSSWHYKMCAKFFTESDIPDNLCGYFWKVVLALFLVFVIVIAILLFVIIPVGTLLSTPFTGILGNEIFWGRVQQVGLGVIFLETLFAGMVLVILGFDKIKNAGRKSLVGEYWEAKKDKVCPMIKFEDK